MSRPAGDPGGHGVSTAGAGAARRLLAADGRSVVLQHWQVAYLIAIVEGRTPAVPPGCGVGKGWLDARLQEAAEAGPDEPLW